VCALSRISFPSAIISQAKRLVHALVDEGLVMDGSQVSQVHEEIALLLESVASHTKDMLSSMSAIHKHLEPEVFYSHIRPYLSGWKANPSLPQGVIYQGVKGRRKGRDKIGRFQFSGGSSAQSSIIGKQQQQQQ